MFSATISLVLLVLAQAAAPAPPAPPTPARGASRVMDEATGLGVSLPHPFEATRGVMGGQDVMIRIVSSTGVPPSGNVDGVLCGVAFKAAPANAALTQAEINEYITSDESIATAMGPIRVIFDVLSQATVELSGVKGLEIWGRPKMGPKSAETAVQLTIFETPKGRTTVSCATTMAAMEEAKLHLASIRSAITLPR